MLYNVTRDIISLVGKIAQLVITDGRHPTAPPPLKVPSGDTRLVLPTLIPLTLQVVAGNKVC